MGSASTRYDIVLRALKLAGRGVELRSLGEQLLNDLLRSWAIEFRYPSLKKVGSPISLPQGQLTASLPSDFGAGVDNLIFGSEATPINEKTLDEFVQMGGMSSQPGTTGRPSFYYVDLNARVFRFNVPSDQDYTFIPVYFSIPDPIPQTPAGDAATVWMPDDKMAVQGLVLEIYQYTGDQREFTQEKRVMMLKDNFRRGIIGLSGGGQRIQLSSARFRTNTSSSR